MIRVRPRTQEATSLWFVYASTIVASIVASLAWNAMPWSVGVAVAANG